MTGERVVTENRLAGSGRVAKNRGSEGHFFEMGDYPRVRDRQEVVEPVNELGEHRPAIVLTHGFEDPYNMDHPPASHGTLEAACARRSRAIRLRGKEAETTPRRSSSSSRTSRSNAISGRRCGWRSRRSGSASAMAMESMAAQQRLVKYSTDAGLSSERPIRASGTSSTRKCSNAFIRE
jgi:hypothetical protein